MYGIYIRGKISKAIYPLDYASLIKRHANLFQNLKATLRDKGRLLTTMVPSFKESAQEIYQQQYELFEMVDYWFILTTDFHPLWHKTMALAPMRTSDGMGIVNILFAL